MINNFDKDLLKIIQHYDVMPQLKYFQSEDYYNWDIGIAP